MGRFEGLGSLNIRIVTYITSSHSCENTTLKSQIEYVQMLD